MSNFQLPISLSGLLAVCLLAACDRKPAPHVRRGLMEPPAFWVWHRSSPLKPAEVETLRSNGVRTLSWQVAECGWSGKDWLVNRIAGPIDGGGDLKIVPVFRLKPDAGFLGAPAAAESLAKAVRAWHGERAAPDEIELDFDCPARLLDNYAKFLRAFGDEVHPARVSITALASWPDHPRFEKLADAVSSFHPMFYDLTADTAEEARNNRFQAMADEPVAVWMEAWKSCPKPWRAGLPSFERVTVFKADGTFIGHLRGWRADEVFFHPCLKPTPLGNGMTRFEVTAAGDLAGTRIEPGMKVVHRAPDVGELADLAKFAELYGAEGVIWFALPGPGIPAALSAAQLTHLKAAAGPTLSLERNGVLRLENPGPADLTTRAWELEIRSSQPAAFRSASPGEFAEVTTVDAVPAELSTTLTLRFSRLPAGESIRSGPLVRDGGALTWSLRGLTPEQPLKAVDSAR
jgi:hypothetical protein